jgi:hypothetical protein
MMVLLAALVLVADPHAAWSDGWLCNTARIRGPGQAQALSRHHRGAPVVARLPPGARVYVCDETRTWVKVHFSTPKIRCPEAHDGLAFRRAKACPSGWVRQHRVEVLSG